MTRITAIKITDEVTVVLSNIVSYAVEKGLSYPKLKADAIPGSENPEDYGTSAADTISFFFLAGQHLIFRVGEEITREDYDRISATLKSLEFDLERKSGSNKSAKGTA